MNTGTLISFQPQESALAYESFFGLKEKPFSLDSDPRFLYHSPSHAATYESLLAGIRRREGMLVLTGEIGTGKTTLCRAVLRNLGRKTFSSFVPDPFASREDLLKMLLIDFGVLTIQDLTAGPLQQASRTELSYLLAGFLDSLAELDAYVVVIIDEAQNMSLPLIEETRILFDSYGGKGRLQIVFVGQLELHAKLALPEMRQVDQRICGYSRLAPLGAESVAGYIQHRLLVAGRGREAALFSPDAIATLHRRSGGVPRLINRVCDRALHLAHRQRAASVDREIMEAALIDVGSTTLTPTWASIVFPEPDVKPPSASITSPFAAVEAAAAAEPASFSKLVDTWVERDLPPASLGFTPLDVPAKRTPEAPAQQPSAAPRRVVKRKAPAQSGWRDLSGELRDETYVHRLWRTWTKRVAVAVVCVAVLEVIVFNAAQLPDLLASLTMASPELPAVTPPPPLAVAGRVPSVAPPAAEPTDAPRLFVSGDYLVAVGVFASSERANQLEMALTLAGLPAVQRPVQLRNQRVQQVVLGPFTSRSDAIEGLHALRQLGGYDDATVIDTFLEPYAP